MAGKRKLKGARLGYVVVLPDGRVVGGFLYPSGAEPDRTLFPQAVAFAPECWALAYRWDEDCRPFLWLTEASALHVVRGVGGELVIVDQDRDGPWGPVSG